MTRSADLIDEVHILRREHEKLELEKRIAELKAKPPIDEGCVGCCKVVDVAARLQEELEDTEIKLVGCRNLIDDRDRIIREMDVTISDLMDNDKKINGFLDEYQVTVGNRDKTIEEYKETIRLERIDRAAEKKIINRIFCEDLRKLNATIEELKDRNAEDLYKQYSLDKEEIDRLKDELSARKEDSAVLMKVVEIVKRWDGLSVADRYSTSAVVEMRHLCNVVKDHTDAPEVPPETPIDEKVCVFCGCKNPSIQVGVDWFCSMRCVDGQADVNKHIHDAGEPQEITVTVAFLELL